MEIVHAKINPKAIESSRPGGERYDEVGTVVRDMIAFGIDIIPDVHVRTPFAERALGNDEVRIIGGWRSQFRGTLVAAPGLKSMAELRGKRIGDWYKGGIATMWYEGAISPGGHRSGSRSGLENWLQVRLAARGLETLVGRNNGRSHSPESFRAATARAWL